MWTRIDAEQRKTTSLRHLIYALRFTGQAVPVGPAGAVLKAATIAPSSTITSSVGPDGLAGSVHPAAGGEATFASEVTFTSETDFQETGAITFGDGNRLRFRFRTVGSSSLDASADPALKHGTVMWRIEGGEGQFAGASGLITSNFFVDAELAITDHHIGVLFLP